MIGTVSRILSRHGAVHTLRRATVAAGPNAWTEGAAVVTYARCTAREIADARAATEAGGETQTTIVIDAASSTLVPVRGDRIAQGTHSVDAGADWRQITHVETNRVAGVGVSYRCTVRR